jgi:membrane protease YdiL (CAAX protease family)
MADTDTTIQKPKKSLFPPWSPVTAVIMVIAVYLGASLAGELAFVLYGSFKGWSTNQLSAWLDRSTYAQFANTLMVYGLMALAIYAFARSYKVSLSALGFIRPRLKDLAIALLGLPIYILGYFILLQVVTGLFPSIDANQQQQIGFQPSNTQLGLMITFISLVVLPPLVEEFLLRGFVFTSILKRFRFAGAAIITSIVFAVAHLQFGSGAPLLWVAAIDTFMLSMVLCFMRYRTGSLWPGIFLHALKNCIAFLSIFVFHLS